MRRMQAVAAVVGLGEIGRPRRIAQYGVEIQHAVEGLLTPYPIVDRLAQRFTVRLQAGLDNSIDLIWSWRWD